MTCAVVGIGRTTYSRNSGRTTRAMAVAACRDAIADAGLTSADIDGICTYMANDSEQPINVGWALGIDELAWANAMYGGGNLVADQIATAAAGTSSSGVPTWDSVFFIPTATSAIPAIIGKCR